MRVLGTQGLEAVPTQLTAHQLLEMTGRWIENSFIVLVSEGHNTNWSKVLLACGDFLSGKTRRKLMLCHLATLNG